MSDEKFVYKFRVEDYFKKGMSYELILVKGTKTYNELSIAVNFNNEYETDCDILRTTVICDGFDTEDTRLIFIAYDIKEEKPVRFTITADQLVKYVGLQNDGTINIPPNRDDYICITRIPSSAWIKGPAENCFGSVSGNVPSFMLEHVLVKDYKRFSSNEYIIGKAYHIKAWKNHIHICEMMQDRIILEGCDGIFIGYDDNNKVARFYVVYPNGFGQTIEMRFEFTKEYIEKRDIQIIEMIIPSDYEKFTNKT